MRPLPLRTFGRYRPNSVWVPDDIDGLPSTHLDDGRYLPTDPDHLLYSAEIDNGRAFRCCRPEHCLWLCPPLWPLVLAGGMNLMCQSCTTCDEMCCYVRKEYSKRTFYRVFPNRIEINEPHARLFGMCGCGSWNADAILTHPFDRGAFGFRAVRCGTIELMTCCRATTPPYSGQQHVMSSIVPHRTGRNPNAPRSNGWVRMASAFHDPQPHMPKHLACGSLISIRLGYTR